MASPKIVQDVMAAYYVQYKEGGDFKTILMNSFGWKHCPYCGQLLDLCLCNDQKYAQRRDNSE